MYVYIKEIFFKYGAHHAKWNVHCCSSTCNLCSKCESQFYDVVWLSWHTTPGCVSLSGLRELLFQSCSRTSPPSAPPAWIKFLPSDLLSLPPPFLPPGKEWKKWRRRNIQSWPCSSSSSCCCPYYVSWLFFEVGAEKRWGGERDLFVAAVSDLVWHPRQF